MDFISPQDIRIGTVFTTRRAGSGRAMKVGTNVVAHTVTDILSVYNRNGDLVETRYVAEHDFCGQKVQRRDFVAVTIQRGFISSPEIKHVWQRNSDIFVEYTDFEVLSATLMRSNGSGTMNGSHDCNGMESVAPVKLGSRHWDQIVKELIKC